MKNFKDYAQKLRKAFVILDGEERAARILKERARLPPSTELTLVEDEALLAENAGLTEWPRGADRLVRRGLPRACRRRCWPPR